ncbi:MAG: hypothetical protein Q7S53_04015 [bacterium]|nr:hypothetical protein [bacterium]
MIIAIILAAVALFVIPQVFREKEKDDGLNVAAGIFAAAVIVVIGALVGDVVKDHLSSEVVVSEINIASDPGNPNNFILDKYYVPGKRGSGRTYYTLLTAEGDGSYKPTSFDSSHFAVIPEDRQDAVLLVKTRSCTAGPWASFISTCFHDEKPDFELHQPASSSGEA